MRKIGHPVRMLPPDRGASYRPLLVAKFCSPSRRYLRYETNRPLLGNAFCPRVGRKGASACLASCSRTGDIVARIFKGAQPGDLPFEQPTRYVFLVNLKTAKATGIELQPALVAIADEVIE